jgi:hypothetical protein
MADVGSAACAEPVAPGGVVSLLPSNGREDALESNGQWQKTIWKYLSDPTVGVAATLVVVLIAAWFVVQPGGLHPGAFALFGRG